MAAHPQALARALLVAVALAAACGGASGIEPDRRTAGAASDSAGGAASGPSIGNGGAASGPSIGNGGAASGPSIGGGGAASGPAVGSGGEATGPGITSGPSGSGGGGGSGGSGGPVCFSETQQGESACACFPDAASAQGASSGATQVTSCSANFDCCCSGTSGETCACFQLPGSVTCDQICGAESTSVVSSCP